MDSLAEKVLTETKAVITKLDLKFGHLVTIEFPESVKDSGDKLLTKLNAWWISQQPYFRGAKLMVLRAGVKVGVETDKSLRELGYVRLEDQIGQRTVRDILTQFLESSHEGVGVQGPSDHDSGVGSVG